MERSLQADGTYLDENGYFYTTLTGGLPILPTKTTVFGEEDDDITVSDTNIGFSTFGGFGRDTITGSVNGDLIYGNQSVDSIIGGNGNDTLFGGQNDGPVGSDGFRREGTETVRGGNGEDVIYGNHGNDVLFGDAGNDSIFGGQNDDTLSGGAGADVLFGNLGNDSLIGGNSNDILYGGSGIDTLDGGTGSDTLYVSNNTSATAYYDDTESNSNGTDALYLGYGSTLTLLTKSSGQYAVTTSGDTLTISGTGSSRDVMSVTGSTDGSLDGPDSTLTLPDGTTMYQFTAANSSWNLL